MLTPPPKRVTFEHESGHVVVARAGGGTVDYVALNAEVSGSTVSLAHAEWRPRIGDSNTMVAGFIAGPTQTRITVERLGLAPRYAEQSIELESKDFAILLSQRNSSAPNFDDARAMFDRVQPAVEQYLREEAVQSVVQTIADALERAAADGRDRVEWSELEGLVDWNSLPGLPSLGS